VARPRIFAKRISKSAVKIDDRLSILPNRYCSPKLAKFLEILVKQWFQSLQKLAWIQLHGRILNNERRFPKRCAATQGAAVSSPPPQKGWIGNRPSLLLDASRKLALVQNVFLAV